MKFDIDSIEASASNTFDVNVGQRADGTPVGFTVVGPGSEQYAQADRAIQLINVKEAATRNGEVDMTTDDGAAVVVDGSARRKVEILRHCVIGWHGFTKGDQPAEFNVEDLERMLSRRRDWIMALLAAIEDEANFETG